MFPLINAHFTTTKSPFGSYMHINEYNRKMI